MGIARKNKTDCLFDKNKQKLQRGTSTTASLSAAGVEPQATFKIPSRFLAFQLLYGQAHSDYMFTIIWKATVEVTDEEKKNKFGMKLSSQMVRHARDRLSNTGTR